VSRLLQLVFDFFVNYTERDFIFHCDGRDGGFRLFESAKFWSLRQLRFKQLLVSGLLIECQNQILKLVELLLFPFCEEGVQDYSEAPLELADGVKDGALAVPSRFTSHAIGHQLKAVSYLSLFFPLVEQSQSLFNRCPVHLGRLSGFYCL